MIVPEESVAILDNIATALQSDGPIEIGTMFRSPGLRSEGKIVAFLGSDGRLIVKLPRDRSAQLFADGDAEPVTMGARTMREWVAVRAGSDSADTEQRWTQFAREAFDYVRTLAE